MAVPNALRSHDPLSFCTKPQIPVQSIQHTATRLQCISNYKLRSEAAREEPMLRRLLGHITVYDNVRAWHLKNTVSTFSQINNGDTSNDNELSDYLRHIPSFQDFQAAIQDQLATMAEVSASAQQLTVEEYESGSEDDSEYDSYDGEDWSDDDDDDTATENGSITDGELNENESSYSRSSTPDAEHFCIQDNHEVTTLQPLAPLVNNMIRS